MALYYTFEKFFFSGSVLVAGDSNVHRINNVVQDQDMPIKCLPISGARYTHDKKEFRKKLKECLRKDSYGQLYLFLGSNDVLMSNNVFYRNVIEVCDMVHETAPGIEITLCEIPPRRQSQWKWRLSVLKLNKMQEWIVMANNILKQISFLTPNVKFLSTFLSAQHLSLDGLHLGREGAEQCYEVIVEDMNFHNRPTYDRHSSLDIEDWPVLGEFNIEATVDEYPTTYADIVQTEIQTEMLKCGISCLSCYMMGMLVFLVLSEIGLCAGLTVKLNQSVCELSYNLGVYKDVQLEHLGSEIIQDDPCPVEFSNWSEEKYICVSVEEMQLDCATKLEYRRNFMYTSFYLAPEIEMSCGNESLEEWCVSTRDNIFIVLKKPRKVTSDVIHLKVYLKDAPNKSKHNSTVIYTIIPILGVAVVAIIILYCKNRRRSGYPEIDYHSASDTVAVHTGDPYETTPGHQPTPREDYTGQEGHQYKVNGVKGGYNEHGVWSAYPMGREPAPGSQDLLSGNAPSQDVPTVPPPLYSSVVDEKH